MEQERRNESKDVGSFFCISGTIEADMNNHPLNAGFTEGSDEELAFLYQLGLALASGKDLFSTLFTLQTTILKLIQADAMFIAIYDKSTDIVEYPICFDVGSPGSQPSRRLSDRPGLTGAVINSGATLYLPDMITDEVIRQYAPVDDDKNSVMRTFLGIPLAVNNSVFGVLSVQSTQENAYSAEQIQLMENVAIQAALAIDKSRLLDQLKNELRERKAVEVDLRQRESILEAVTFAAEQFLKTPDWRLEIDHVLERLGTTMHVTHAYLFEDHLDAAGEAATSMRYEWTAAGYASDLHNPEFQNSLINEHGYEDLIAAMGRGDVRARNAATFNEVEKNAMNRLGVKAILEVPIFVNNQEWGAMGFDDLEQERLWTSAEVDALKIASGVLGAAIQRQEADAAVRESERIYRQAIEALGAIPYYRDYESGLYGFIGSGVKEITGYSAEDLTPEIWNGLILDIKLKAELSDITEGDVVRFVQGDFLRSWKCDYRIRARDGQERWIADRAVDLMNENGTAYASVGILQDITERKLVEANLRQGEAILEVVAEAANTFLKISEWNRYVWQQGVDRLLERLGTAIHASHAYLFVNDVLPEGQILMTMQYEWTATGFESDLGNPKYIKMIVGTDYRESWNGSIQNGFPYIGDPDHLAPEDMEELRSRKIQALLDVPIFIDGLWWGTIGFDDMQQPRHWSTTEVDALVVAANLLGAAVKRNQMDSILQRELEERKSLIHELESKNQELERFTYTVSHDLKSPLFTIRGFLGYLEQDAQSGNHERLTADIQRISEATDKMQRLLNDLLELSRIGRMKNESVLIPFGEIVQDAAGLVEGRLSQNRVALQIEENLPVVYGDRPRLVEVMQNLLDNAAKFMGDRPDPRIEVGWVRDVTLSDRATLFVHDNGIGIAPEHFERIFGLFNKLDPHSEGTGIGLAMVKRIIEVHGGRVWVESEVGMGTTFFFTLPAQPLSDSVI
jgi:PAS domain S-box-containing protein